MVLPARDQDIEKFSVVCFAGSRHNLQNGRGALAYGQISLFTAQVCLHPLLYLLECDARKVVLGYLRQGRLQRR